jgi:hypothetical protein
LPHATLDIVWAVLKDDPRRWPFDLEDIIDNLAQKPKSERGSRLEILRRPGH